MGISIIDTPGSVKLKLDFYGRKRQKSEAIKSEKKNKFKRTGNYCNKVICTEFK